MKIIRYASFGMIGAVILAIIGVRDDETKGKMFHNERLEYEALLREKFAVQKNHRMYDQVNPQIYKNQNPALLHQIRTRRD